MELTEISGNIRLCFNDFIYGLPVCSSAEHITLLDSDSEISFVAVYPQYFKLFHTAINLQNIGKAFDLYFSVLGNVLSGPPYSEPQTLYFCHIQGWNNHLAIDLILPGSKEIVRKEFLSSSCAVSKAINFAFGGLIFTCLDFSIKDIDLSNPSVSESLKLYCLANDKQVLLNKLFD